MFYSFFSAGVLRFPLSGSDHIPLAPEEYDERAEGETEEEYGQDHCKFFLVYEVAKH